MLIEHIVDFFMVLLKNYNQIWPT